MDLMATTVALAYLESWTLSLTKFLEDALTAHPDLRDRLDQMVCLAKRDLLDALDRLEDLDARALVDLMESRASRVNLGDLDNLEDRDHQGAMEGADVDHQGAKGQLGRVDHRDRQEKTASAAQMGNQESKDHQEGLAEMAAQERTGAQDR